MITGDAAADELLNTDGTALLIGMLLDQQVPMEMAFHGPATLRQRLGHLEAARVATMSEDEVVAVCCEKPAIHRFPGNMAKRVQELCAVVEEEYGGDAGRVWGDASDSAELKRRLEALPGFGEMKVKALASVLARRYGIAMAEPLVPDHAMLGDVDSPEALAEYQAAKRAYKASLRAAAG